MPIDMHNGDYVRLADILQPHVNLSVPVSFLFFPAHSLRSFTIQKLYHSYILVDDSTIETPVSFAVEQLKTISVCKTKQ